ncbi:orotidine-5'-phosphate decarboxylase [Candidatus Microgenomates bacterium]|nr:orotidine-5'-phosphate decarboxylase [Candidatus Microgenomates bacterium]
MNFFKKLNQSIKKNNSLLCIGLDTDISKIPKRFLTRSDLVFEFNKNIIDLTTDLVCCYKANIAFYAAQGIPGLKSLQKTIRYIHKHNLPFILDAKRGDVENTAQNYVKEAFDVLEADAVTLNPYLGFDTIEPFLKRKDKGIIVLCRTSNPGASDFQSTEVSIGNHPGGINEATPREKTEPLYMLVARKVVEWNKKYKNCLLVVGATWPTELELIRKIAPDMFFLVPGIGAQGGDLEQTLKFGLTKEKSGLTPKNSGLIISSSRSIIYSNNPKKKAQELQEAINRYRK